uniref:Reverse transcriptase domain-containing protein n=1 Tax=Tanacetum cinerariifolium TaxID=118510 RepID=A0A6L2MAV3_TANCI|nr:reverse transcriptase domain-containing protein [Tanacetum cinerariifolium]
MGAGLCWEGGGMVVGVVGCGGEASGKREEVLKVVAGNLDECTVPILACCGGLVESGLQERYGLIEMEEGVAGKGVQVLGGKHCEVHSVLNVGVTREYVWGFYNFGPCASLGLRPEEALVLLRIHCECTQTHSSSRLVSNPSSNLTPYTNPNPKGRNHRRSKQRIKDFNLEELSPPIVTIADQRTMAQFLQAPTEGYEDAIVVLAITADNFELKHDQDSLNSVAGGNFLDKMPRECLDIIESKSKVCYSSNKPVVAKVSSNTSTSGISYDVAELKDMVKALLLDKKCQNQSPAPMKAVKESCMAECLELADLGASINLMPFSVWKKLSLPNLTPTYMTLELADRSISRPVGVAEDVYVKTGRALTDMFEGDLTIRVGKEAITFNLDQTSRYSANYSDMTAKQIDVIDMAYEEYSHEVLGFYDTISSGNPPPYYDPIIYTTSPTLTPFENSDFLPEEVDAFLAIEDDPTSPEFY